MAIAEPKSKLLASPQNNAIANSVVDAGSMRAAFLEGFITNVFNPKVSMFYLAAFPQFMPNSESAISAYALVTTHTVLNFIWFSIMVIMLAKVKDVTNSARFKMWLNSITGVFFIALGSKLAFMKNA